ncbi:MAG: histone deacetylase [Polyangiales bacterium]
MTATPPAAQRLSLITDARFDRHAPTGHHPERPARRGAAVAGAERGAEGSSRVHVEARAATDDEVLRAHSDAHLSRLRDACAGPAGYLDPDTYHGRHSLDAALLAAGSACEMVDALMDDRADVAMLLARPPGHHATRERAMGFCLINNVAVAAAHARSRGARRVAVVDWDVHHGNGTQDIFYRDPSVLFVSLHQAPLYPDSGWVDEVGMGEGRGFSVNLPLPAGCDGALYARAFERVVLPVVESFAPELVLVSAGFDAHARDPLASQLLEAADFGWMASRVRDIASRVGHGRVGLVLEGGYDLGALEASVEAAVRGALQPHADAHPLVKDDPSADTARRILDAVINAQSPYWPSLREG